MKKVLILAGGLLLAACAYLLWDSWDLSMAALKEPINVYDNELSSVPRYAAVECDINKLLDCFGAVEARAVSQSTGAVSVKGTEYYYALPFQTADGVYYIALGIDSGKKELYDGVVDSSYRWIMDETDSLDESRHFTGVMKELNDEMYGYMKEMLLEQGFVENETEAEKHVLPLYLKETDGIRKTRTMFLLALFAAGAVILAVGLVRKEKPGKLE